MKKIFMMAIAAAALTISCTGNKNNAPVDEAIDTLAVLTEEANTAADEMVSNLGSLLETKDLSAFQGALETVKTKIAEFIGKNPEVALGYIGKVQSFLKDNADAIKAFVGSNAAISGLVDGIANIPSDSVDKLLGASEALGALGIDTKSLITNAAESAVEGAIDNAKEAVGDAADAVKDAAADAVQDAKDKAADAVQGAKDKAADAVDKGADAVKKGLGL
jgi:uncharacterized protein YjbJ (UPF0337 family)